MQRNERGTTPTNQTSLRHTHVCLFGLTGPVVGDVFESDLDLGGIGVCHARCQEKDQRKGQDAVLQSNAPAKWSRGADAILAMKGTLPKVVHRFGYRQFVWNLQLIPRSGLSQIHRQIQNLRYIQIQIQIQIQITHFHSAHDSVRSRETHRQAGTTHKKAQLICVLPRRGSRIPVPILPDPTRFFVSSSR
jgi:hypothetical protein